MFEHVPSLEHALAPKEMVVRLEAFEPTYEHALLFELLLVQAPNPIETV